jgi:hypothetical protein
MTDSIRAALPSQALTPGMGHAPPSGETVALAPGFGQVFLAVPMGDPGAMAEPAAAALSEPPLMPVTPEVTVFQIPAPVLPMPVDPGLVPSGALGPAPGRPQTAPAGLGATALPGSDVPAPRPADAMTPEMAGHALADDGTGPDSSVPLAPARQMAGVAGAVPPLPPARPPESSVADVVDGADVAEGVDGAGGPRKTVAPVPQPAGDAPQKAFMPPAPLSPAPVAVVAGEGMESAGLSLPPPAVSPSARPLHGRAVPAVSLTAPLPPDMIAETPAAAAATDPAVPQPRSVPGLQAAEGRSPPKGGALGNLPVGSEALADTGDDPLAGAGLPAATAAPAAPPGGNAAPPAGGAAAPLPPTAPPLAPQQTAPGMMLTVETPGDVRLVILPEGEAPHLLFVAERAETLDLLRRSADLLSAELRALGLADARFDFAGRDGLAGQGRGNPGAGNDAAPAAASTDPAPAAPPLSVRSGALASGRLDLRL